MSGTNQGNSSGCGCLFLIFLIMFSSQAWFWSVLLFVAFSLISGYMISLLFNAIVKNFLDSESSSEATLSNSQTDQEQRFRNTSSADRVHRTQSLRRNRNLQNIQWTEIGTYYSNNPQLNESSPPIEFDVDFFNNKRQNANIDELLTNLIDQKDRVTGEKFHQGEKVYFCVSCQLGYHEDSWQFLDRRCEQCKSSKVKLYTLPLSSSREIEQTNTNVSSRTYELMVSGLNNAKSGDYTQAIDKFTELVGVNPKNAMAFYNRGLASYKLGKFHQAINDFSQAIVFDQNYVDAYNNRGNARMKIGDRQGALEDYQKALRLNPNHAFAKKNLDILNSIQNQAPTANSHSRIRENAGEFINALDSETIYMNIGKRVTIRGRIKNISYMDNVIFLHFTETLFSGLYLYIVVKNENDDLMDAQYSTTYFKNKEVKVSGLLTLNHKGKPRMKLILRSQLKVLEI